HPGHLAVAVLRVVAGGARIAGAGPATRMHGGHPGADAVALDERGVAHLCTWHVGDRVPGTGAPGEGDPQRPSPLLARRRGELRIGLGARHAAHASAWAFSAPGSSPWSRAGWRRLQARPPWGRM